MFLVLCIPFLRCYYVGKTESIRTLINIWVIITVCISLPLLYRQTATEDRAKGFSTYDHFPSHSCTADFCISHSHSGRCARTMMCYEVALTAAGHCINSTCTPHNGAQRPHAPHPLKASPWGRSHRGGGRTRCQFVSDPILFRRLVGEVPGSWKKLIFCQYFEGKQDELGIYRAASLVLISGKNNRKAVTNAISKELRAGSITNGNQHSIMEKKSYHINLISLQVCLAKLLGK